MKITLHQVVLTLLQHFLSTAGGLGLVWATSSHKLSWTKIIFCVCVTNVFLIFGNNFIYNTNNCKNNDKDSNYEEKPEKCKVCQYLGKSVCDISLH